MGVDGVAIHVVHVRRADAGVKLGLAKPTRNADGGLFDEDGSVLCRAGRHFGRIAGPIKKTTS